MRCYTILYFTLLYFALLYYTIHYYKFLYITIHYYTIRYYDLLYVTKKYSYTILHYTLLYMTTYITSYLCVLPLRVSCRLGGTGWHSRNRQIVLAENPLHPKTWKNVAGKFLWPSHGVMEVLMGNIILYVWP